MAFAAIAFAVGVLRDMPDHWLESNRFLLCWKTVSLIPMNTWKRLHSRARGKDKTAIPQKKAGVVLPI